MTVFAKYRSSFDGLPREAWLLATVLLINTSGTMVVFFITLYLTRFLGWSTGLAGIAMGGYGIGMLVGTLSGGLLADRLGPFRVQQISLAGAGVLLVVLSVLHSVAGVLGAIVAWGAITSALYPANAAAMAAVCRPEVRARGFVLNRLAANLGVTVGPVVGGLLAQHDYRLLFWADAATSLLAAFVAWRLFPGRPPAPEPEKAAAAGPARWRDDRVFLALLGAGAGTALVISQLFSTYGMYLKDAGLGEARIGGLIAINTMLIVIAQMPLIHATERFSRTRLAAAGAVLLGTGFASMPLSHSTGYLAATVVVWTFGEMLTMPLLTTLVSLRASAAAQGRYQGLYTMSYSVGATLGPVAGTWAFGHGGGPMLWGGTGCAAAFVAAGMYWLSFTWNGRSGGTT